MATYEHSPAGMTDDDLVTFIEQEEADALDYQSTWLADDRAKSLDYYFGRPFEGDGEEGRSQVISTDVFDGIEGMLPQLLKPFVSTDDTVRFDPEGPDDEDAAEQETHYVNFVLHRRNEGFHILQTWMKDGLLSKVGVVKYFWDTASEVKIERLEGITDDQMQMVAADSDVAVVEHSEYQQPIVMPDGSQAMATFHDCVLRQSVQRGKATVVCLPPEEFLISRDATHVNPKKARYCEHRRYMTLDELRESGFTVPDGVGDGDAGSLEGSPELLSRHSDDGGLTHDSGHVKKYMVRECYPIVDRDGDGVAERRCVTLVGREILSDVEVEEPPFSAWTPILVPHRHTGIAVADILRDFQLIKSTLLRQTMENLANLNNNRTAISNRVNVSDMLNNEVAGLVRIDADQIGNDIMPLVSQPIGDVVMNLASYLDSAKENRTGYTRYNSGLDANSLNKTATGVSKIMEAANERLALVARNFAELGLKDLMLSLHGLLRRHQTQQETVQLTGRWITVSPREWRKRTNMSISVGLGTGDKQLQVQNMMAILQAQKEAVPAGLSSKDKIYNALAKMVNAMGEKNAEQFFTRPQPGQVDPPPMPAPEVQAAQIQAQALVQAEGVKAQGQAQAKQAEIQARTESDAIKAQNEMALAERKLALEMEQSRYQADLNAETKWREKLLEVAGQLLAQSMQAPEPTMDADTGAVPIEPEVPQGDQMQQIMAALTQAVGQLAAITGAPRRIVRGPDGRAMGVEPVM